MDKRYNDVFQRFPHVVDHLPRKLLRLREDGEEQGQRDEQLQDDQQTLENAGQDEQDAFRLVDIQEFIASDDHRLQLSTESAENSLTEMTDKSGCQQE